MKKVLIIDGDIIARRAIAKVLQEKTPHQVFIQPDLEAAVDTIKKTDPDLLLLGIRAGKKEEMAVLSMIQTHFPKLKLILVTERTEEGADFGITALRQGAFDLLTKPEHYNSMLFAEKHLVKRLIPLVQSALKSEAKKDDFGVSYARRSSSLQVYRPLDLIVIGGCTGGPLALFEIISELPKNLSAPVVIVQHLPRYFTSILAARLNSVSELKVREASHGIILKAGEVWIVPGGLHGEVYRNGSRTELKLHKGPRENKARPSIDLLFRSAAKLHGSGVLGIILSGCGTDGIRGAGSIKQAGGQVIVQDYRTASVADLPLSVIRAGYCNLMSSADEIPEHIMKWDSSYPHAMASSPSGRQKALSSRIQGFNKMDDYLFNSITR